MPPMIPAFDDFLGATTEFTSDEVGAAPVALEEALVLVPEPAPAVFDAPAVFEGAEFEPDEPEDPEGDPAPAPPAAAALFVTLK